ncbi:MAG TPA: hypothetical protein DD636_06330 [Anaerolineaceae bacterium]|nr:hypothetical protein [Anaerolineaceae bacterium]
MRNRRVIQARLRILHVTISFACGRYAYTMKPIPFLFKKIRQYDPKMLWMMSANALISAAYPFIWVLVPAAILRNYQRWSVQQVIILVVLAGIGAMLAGFSAAWLKGNYRMRMNTVRYHLIRDLTRVSLKMPYSNTLLPKTLDDINFAHSCVSSPYQGAGMIMLTLLPLTGEILGVLGFATLLTALSPWILILIFLILASNYLIARSDTRYMEGIWDEYQGPARRHESIQQFMTDPLRKKDILLFNTFEMLRAYLQKYARLRYDLDVKVSFRHFQLTSVIILIDFVRDVLIYGWIIRQFAFGAIDASVFTLYTSGLISFMVVSQSLIQNLVKIRMETNRFRKYMDFVIPLEEEITKDEAYLAQPEEDTQAPDILLENLSFTYPNTDKPVLEKLNLHILPEEKLALVGENGAGKSTLIKLLCRLYKPTAGRILLAGKDIWEYSEKEYYRLLSVVFQDAMVLPFTIRDNIAMDTTVNEVHYQDSVDQSGFADTFRSYPTKDETYLLRILDDNGIDLSGGERQKLFLARALYKSESKMLILDEPTAALDPLAEREMYQHYARYTQGRTSIFVSHRLASTRFCDRVAFLKNGRITELGSHDELIAQRGEYQELFEIQAKNYRQRQGSESFTEAGDA